jgi:ferric-dicitrate binding protein FerR (iron transport regulator)
MNEMQQDYLDAEVSEFTGHIRKDADMKGLALPEQVALKGRIDRHNRRHDRRFARRFVWGGSVAASICLLIVVGRYALAPTQTKTADFYSVMQSFESAADASGDVQLMLSDSRTINIEGDDTQLDYSEEGHVGINKSGKVEVPAEAGQEKTVFNQVTVPAGKRSMLILNDGTKVWINSGSKLVFPVNFEKNKREVFVEGEIYLDVVADAARPFTVHTKAIDVNVLGTKFNVSAYADEPDFQVALVSGEVEIRQNGDAKEILKPNQLFSYNGESRDFTVTEIDAQDYIAWKDGYYLFYSHELGAVFAKLSKYYSVRIQCDEKIGKLNCSGKLDLKDNLEDVFHSLEKAAPSIQILKASEREYNVIVKP